MSAVNANAGDREREALRRAQRAHEPSMEEILASIRTIIAEERDPTKASEGKSAFVVAGAPSTAPQIVYSKSDPAVPPREPVASAHRPEPAAKANPPKAVFRPTEVEADQSRSSPAEDDAPLLSPETDEAVASAFGALSANLAARSAELAENLTREMLRPMLKAWLDENLPGIVERLVQAEIERVARGTR